MWSRPARVQKRGWLPILINSMSKHARWLQDQIGAWSEEGLIDERQAAILRDRYPAGDRDTPWARIVVSSVGAVVFGLGIILFFAYNWADMPKYVKLALIFGTVAAAHGAGFYLSGKADAKRGLVESLHVMGTMLFGAGIWLVAQVYHLDEHYPNAFIVWGLGALALAWAMPSTAQGLLAVLLVFLWGCFEVFDFSSPNHAGAWIVLVGVLPLAWMQRSRVLLFFTLVAFLALFVFTAGQVDDDLIASALFYGACVYMAAAVFASRSAFPASAPAFAIVGYSVYLFLIYIFCFRQVARELVKLGPDDLLEWGYFLVPMVVALAAWLALLATGAWKRADTLRRWDLGLILAAMVLVLVAQFVLTRGNAGVVTLAFNFVFLGHCVVMIVRGTGRLNWKLVSLGCVLFAALTFARFVDLFDDLLVRSLLFLFLGAGLFLIGNFYSRRKRLEAASHA